MTVRAANLTLRDFPNYPLPCRSHTNQSANVRLFRASYMIELQDAHIGFTAINAVMRGEVLRHSMAIARAVARGVYHPPLIMECLVSTIMTLAIFALTCPAAASKAIAMFGKTFERKQLMTNSTLLHGKNRTTRKCQHYCTRKSPSSIY